MAANDLLLTHGTIYGTLPPAVPWAIFADMPTTVAAAVAPQPESADYPYAVAPPGYLSGTLTDNSPIDVISWTGAGKFASEGHLSWWEQCMTLFMRHV